MNDDVRFFLGVYQIYALLAGRPRAQHAMEEITPRPRERGNERTNEVSRLGTRVGKKEEILLRRHFTFRLC